MTMILLLFGLAKGKVSHICIFTLNHIFKEWIVHSCFLHQDEGEKQCRLCFESCKHDEPGQISYKVIIVMILTNSYSKIRAQKRRQKRNIARIANAVHCHSLLSDNNDCHEFRFSTVRIAISVSNVTSLQDCLVSQL